MKTAEARKKEACRTLSLPKCSDAGEGYPRSSLFGTTCMPDITDNFQFTAPDFGKNPLTFLKEVKAELSKVAWPSRPEIIRLTAVVLGVSLIAGIYLGGLDFIFAKSLEIFLKR